MVNNNFGRVITAMVTPFDAEENVNYAVAEQLAAHLVDHGSDSILVCGTTGESPTLTWEEEYQLFSAIKQAVGNQAKVIAGTGSNSTQEAIEATQKAASLGIDGSLQVVPYYNKPPQEGLFQHFQAIANASPEMPILLYNIPGRTGQNLLPETVARLAEIENIIAIKEASGNLEQACKIRCQTPDDFTIYAGDDFLTLPLMTVGASGVISVASHLVGEQLQAMIKAFEQGNTTEACQLNLKLFPLFKALFCTTNPIPIKAALNLQGWDVGGVRSPLSNITVELKSRLHDVLKELSLV